MRDRAVVDVPDLAQRGAVAGDEHRAAEQQPLEHALLAVGDHVVRAEHHGQRHHGGREAVRAVLVEQVRLDLELLVPVLGLPLRAVDRVGLADRQHPGPGVDDGRAAEQVVTDPPADDLDQRLHVGQRVARQVRRDVELLRAEHLAQLLVVGPVGVEPADRARQPGLALAPVEHGDLVTPLDQLIHEGEPVETGTAHH